MHIAIDVGCRQCIICTDSRSNSIAVKTMTSSWPSLHLETRATSPAHDAAEIRRFYDRDWTPTSSPISPAGSGGSSERSLHDTPWTTPASSPIKDTPTTFHLPWTCPITIDGTSEIDSDILECAQEDNYKVDSVNDISEVSKTNDLTSSPTLCRHRVPSGLRAAE